LENEIEEEAAADRPFMGEVLLCLPMRLRVEDHRHNCHRHQAAGFVEEECKVDLWVAVVGMAVCHMMEEEDRQYTKVLVHHLFMVILEEDP
jgi:hypothetical protein